MLYNSNPNGSSLAPKGSALRWGAMKLMIGETGPGFVVEPGHYPNNSAKLKYDRTSEDNVISIFCYKLYAVIQKWTISLGSVV